MRNLRNLRRKAILTKIKCMGEKMKVMPDEIVKHFNINPKIGREELSRRAHISEQRARFYGKLYKTSIKTQQIQ